MGSIYYVLKTVDLGQPVLRYASQQNIISQQIRTLTKMQSEHASDPQAVARYRQHRGAAAAAQEPAADGQQGPLPGFVLHLLRRYPQPVRVRRLGLCERGRYQRVKTGGIDARANTQINIVNDSPMLMNVNDAVVMDGTIIRPGSDGEMKIFKSGHLYINDASVKARPVPTWRKCACCS